MEVRSEHRAAWSTALLVKARLERIAQTAAQKVEPKHDRREVSARRTSPLDPGGWRVRLFRYTRVRIQPWRALLRPRPDSSAHLFNFENLSSGMRLAETTGVG